MKKLITFLMLTSILFVGRLAFAASHLEGIQFDVGTQTVSGVFQHDVLLPVDHDIDLSAGIRLQLSDGVGDIAIIPGESGVDNLVYDDVSGEFNVPLGEIYSYDPDEEVLENLSGSSYNRIELVWKTNAGITFVGDPIFVAGNVIDSGPLLGGGGLGEPDGVVPELKVFWHPPVLHNTNGDNSGLWYYEIKTSSDVIKSADGPSFLIMHKIDNDTGTIVPIVLGDYSDSGTVFSVTHPPCIAFGCPDLTSSPIEPGYRYEVFFSYYANGSHMIHAPVDESHQELILDSVPDNINTAAGYIEVISHEYIDDPNGSTYLSADIRVLQDVSGDYNVTVSAKDADGSRDNIDYDLGFVPGRIGSYKMPRAVYPMDISFDSYEVQISHNNKIIEWYDAGSISTPVVNNNNNSSGLTGYTPRQKEILKSGIVPTDCGYEVGLTGRGRMCNLVDAIQLIQNIIEYIFVLVLPIAAIVFAYAGFLLLSSGGNSSKRDAAKNAMVKLVIGVVIVMLAWLLVKTILVALGASSGFTMYLDIGNS